MCVFIYLCVPEQEFMRGHRWIQGEKNKRGGGGLLFVLSVVRQPLPPAFCRVH